MSFECNSGDGGDRWYPRVLANGSKDLVAVFGGGEVAHSGGDGAQAVLPRRLLELGEAGRIGIRARLTRVVQLESAPVRPRTNLRTRFKSAPSLTRT
jgi:hypothetical protein